jgi:uncharacterized protein HemX
VRAASEHPRTAITIAAAVIVLALAGVGAGRALGGAQPIHRSDRALRIPDTQLAQLRQQLQTSETQSAQLRRQVATLTAQLARARQPEQRAQTSTHIKRRTSKR